MNKFLEQLNLEVEPLASTIYVNAHFYPDYSSEVERISLYNLYSNKDVYENVSLQHGFEIYLENNIKLVVDKIDYQGLPFIKTTNNTNKVLLFPKNGTTIEDPVTRRLFIVGQPMTFDLATTQAYERAIQAWQFINPNITPESVRYDNIKNSLIQYFSKSNKIGSFKTLELKYANINMPYFVDDNVVERSIESLFLEIIAKYISKESIPSWGGINGQSLESDYQYTYKKPFGIYTGSLNISAKLQPGLSKVITLSPPWKFLQTNQNYPLLATDDGYILDINPLQEPITQVSNKIRYKISK